ncbi:MAG: hydrogenase nickel incorporation protein HypB [archaeon]
MCKECGCEEKKHKNNVKKKVRKVSKNEKSFLINESVTEMNDFLSDQIKSRLKAKNILCINLMGSPGCGKTSFIEGISKHIPSAEIAVIQGDLESDIDKKRLEASNIYTYQINTHSGCHLNSMMINQAIQEMDLSGKNYLIIENVGNLVCPAGVKIGQHINIVISSTTEGFDKPKKYPYIFMDANIIVISKSDLAKYVNFNEKIYLRDLRNINGKANIIRVSSKNQESFGNAAHYLMHEREHLLKHAHNH